MSVHLCFSWLVLRLAVSTSATMAAKSNSVRSASRSAITPACVHSSEGRTVDCSPVHSFAR
ncbi:hypothetical protein PR003_g31261 [Phytophthora rubi]|uniref:RxLR effector protein n=1 Tax=Phytophthora rubi TaxID=129364 RepID=A0A6A4B995_9STRA|nr:hypothetical protein PR001_g31054 [Phytophthora rubi]KAE8960877.1 hypothetical protein PR002_g30079 [Phytophthora rubi]KAE9269024.1 hypothetical protein PR003_g31261 [Phytophthora rubi]